MKGENMKTYMNILTVSLLSCSMPAFVNAQAANPWNPNRPATVAPVPAPQPTWTPNQPATDKYAPADLDQMLSAEPILIEEIAPVAAPAQPVAPVRTYASDPDVQNSLPGNAPQGYGFNRAPQGFGFPQQGFGYGPAPQGFGTNGFAPGFGNGGFPQQGFGNGFNPGFGNVQPYGSTGNPGNFGGFNQGRGNYPGGYGSPFSGFSPFGFF